VSEQIEDWRVRIWRDGQVTGAGVLISDRHVLTCAHVVDADSGVLQGSPAPEAIVDVDFPDRRGVGHVRARVLDGGWFPEVAEDGDIAILELDEPVGIPSAVVCRTAGRVKRQVSVVGYPPSARRGVRATARVAEPPAPETDWVQLDAVAAVGQHIERGFSGAGVADQEDGSVLGIIVTIQDDLHAGVSWMLPAETIVRYWPPLANQVETVGGVRTIDSLHVTAAAVCAPWHDSHELEAVTSGRVIRRWWNWRERWQQWYDAQLPSVAADLSVFSKAEGQMDCIVADVHGRVWRTSRRDERWLAWQTFSAPDTNPPDASSPNQPIKSPTVTRVASVSTGPMHGEIFAVTGAGELVHRWHRMKHAADEESWSDWHVFKTDAPVADVSAASARGGYMSCFITDTHGRVGRTSHDGERWASWHRMRVPTETKSPAVVRVAAASLALGHQEVFAVTAAGELIHRWQWEGSAWSSWHTLETPGAVADVAATSQPDGLYECVITDTKGQLWHARFDKATYWSAFESITSLPIAGK
jgi:hypothetical protein